MTVWEQHPRRFWGTALLGFVAVIGFNAVSNAQTNSAPAPPTAEQAAFFESRVRPILVNQCVSCHGPSLQSAGIRLDNANDARKVLVSGDPDKSRLIHAVLYTGPIKMPPDGKRPASEIAALTAWVKMGAPWPTDASKATPDKGSAPLAADWASRTKLWSFQPVRPVMPPKVRHTTWVKNPVDAFILANLEAKGLSPAPAAGKRALIRRAYYDLIGLPPTPVQVEAFVQDHSSDAFARVVDGLLASPQFGERWARHWLDLVRYADSNGLDENKSFAYAWRYRDWVVNALNQDKPYDAFLQEQLAGDLMDSGNDETLRNSRITATGFLTLGAKVLAEQDKPKMVMDIIDEQIDVTTKATMGLTVACARCHDHKFDPITTKDYYALAGIFKSTKTMKDLGFVSDWNERTLSTHELEEARRKYTESLKPLENGLSVATAKANDEVVAGIKANAAKYLHAGAEYARQPGILVSQAEAPQRPDSPYRQLVEATDYVRGNAVRDRDNYGKGIGVLVTNAAPVSAEWDITLPRAGNYQLELRYAAEESRPIHILINGKLVNENAAAAITGSWFPEGQRWEAQGIYAFTAGKNTLKIERLDGPIPHINRLLLIASAQGASVPKRDNTLSSEEIAKRDNLIPEVVSRFAGRLIGVSNLENELPDLLRDASLFGAPQKPEMYYSPAAKDTVKKAQDALDTARKGMPEIPVVMAVEDEIKPEDVRVHLRGSTLTLGDVAPRGFPAVLTRYCPPDPKTPIDDHGSGRLALARWLTRPEHPLTARVAVNRLWQHLFGEGIVPTPDNWGAKGEKPTNPALLDYLASTFTKEDGWSQKRMLRRLMLSSTYQMSTTSPIAVKAASIDPENRLLWRMNRRRLEAEPLRDGLLSVAGLLDLTMGGTLLTTPDNDYVTNDQSADQARYNAPRRSIYLPVIRNSIYGLFQAFDFGDGTTVNAQRASTTVAPQALFLLNSPLVRDAAQAFATSLLTGANASKTDEARVRQAYYRAFARPATAVEVTSSLAYLARFNQVLATIEPDTAKRQTRTWQSFCQVLFASNEFSYVE